MNTYKIADIQRLLTEAAPRFVCLEDSQGNRLIPFNTKDSPPFKEQLKRVCERLKAEVLTDGTYYVVFGESTLKGAPLTRLPFIKGNPSKEPAPVVMVGENNKTMSQSEAIALIKENAELKADNEVLRMQDKNNKETIKILEDEIAELENAEPERPGFFGMSEGMEAKVSDLLGALAQKFLSPAPPATPATPAPIAENKQVTYDDILNILKNNPDVVSQLRKDLNPEPAQNGQS